MWMFPIAVAKNDPDISCISIRAMISLVNIGPSWTYRPCIVDCYHLVTIIIIINHGQPSVATVAIINHFQP